MLLFNRVGYYEGDHWIRLIESLFATDILEIAPGTNSVIFLTNKEPIDNVLV